MAQKTRYPRNLGIDDFISFIRVLLLWLASQVGDPDYRAVLVDGLQAKFDALEAKMLLYKQLKIHVPEINKLYNNSAKALRNGLVMLRGIMPSFYEDPDVLGLFGLANPIPSDLDELYSTGRVCFDKWADVSADPEYAPVVPDFEDVLVLFNDFVTKRDEYEAKSLLRQQLQNDMLELRDEIEEQEREIFHYYSAKHPDENAEWWTDTPWGTSSGGGSEKLPAVSGFGMEFLDPNLHLYWEAVSGADGYKLMMGNNPIILTTTIYTGPDTEFTFDPPGGHLYFKVWAMKGDELGEPGEALDIVIEGVAPPKPMNIRLERVDNYVKIGWDAGEGTVPQYFRLYTVIVPTGSPAPVKPDEPEVDELITTSVSIFAPAPGNKVYAWVTAFGDGAESNAEGPGSIDIM